MANVNVISEGPGPLPRDVRRYLQNGDAAASAGSDDGADRAAAGVRRRGPGNPNVIAAVPAGDADLEILMVAPGAGAGRPAAPLSAAALVGESAPMQALKRRLRQLLDVEKHGGGRQLAAVLISGETGTGKKLLAQALHFEGARRDAPFVKVDCASLTPPRFEAELFGIGSEGSAPGGERRVGLVEAADGGTLLLDEIDELELPCQARLLKLLEEQRFWGDGGRERRVDIRVIATTDRDLERMVRQGRFRGDLYFRLCVVTLAMPPLRRMVDDIPRLAEFYLQRHGLRYGRSGLRLSAAAQARLSAYDWPGNVRELSNKLEQTVLLGQGELIDAEQLGIAAAPAEAASPHRRESAAAAADPGNAEPDAEQRDALRRALDKTAWNVSRSARLLGLSRDTIRYRIRKFGFVRPSE